MNFTEFRLLVSRTEDWPYAFLDTIETSTIIFLNVLILPRISSDFFNHLFVPINFLVKSFVLFNAGSVV